MSSRIQLVPIRLFVLTDFQAQWSWSSEGQTSEPEETILQKQLKNAVTIMGISGGIIKHWSVREGLAAFLYPGVTI